METAKSRVTGESMRVAIVSTPRTCSSFLGSMMAKKYKLEEYSEIFSYGNASVERGMEKLQKLKDTDNYSVKITSTSFRLHTEIISPETFPWEIFDKIILAEREDLSQQVASWMLLNHAQLNGHFDHNNLVKYLTIELKNVQNIPFLDHDFENVMTDINYFYNEIKNSLIKFADKVNVVKYELLQKQPEDYLTELNNILETDFSIQDISGVATKTELDYTPFIDYYNLREKVYATKEENNESVTTEHPFENEGTV